jgi:hypothetical protein
VRIGSHVVELSVSGFLVQELGSTLHHPAFAEHETPGDDLGAHHEGRVLAEHPSFVGGITVLDDQ